MSTYDFDTPNVELAEAVFQVAEDCDDSKHIIRFRIDVDDMNIDISSFLRSTIRHRYPDVNEAELDQFIEQFKLEQEEKKAARKAKKERLTNAIKDKIRGQSQAGWELAYKLCYGLEDTKSKKLRYKLFDKIPQLSLQEKIEICKQYLTVIENAPEDRTISNVYLSLAELSSQAKLAAVSYNIEETSYYLDSWFFLNDDQISSAEKIIDFCIKHKLEEELQIWIKKYENICLKNGKSARFSETLRHKVSTLHQTGLAEKTFQLIDAKLLTSEIARTLVAFHEYESAIYVYDQIANIEIQNNKYSETDSDRLAWLERVKYKRKYDALIRSFDSNWTAIYIYDYCYANDPAINEEINRLKEKYHDVFNLHRQCLTFIHFYRCQRLADKQVIHQRLIDTYEKEVSIIPQVLTFFEEYSLLLKNKKDNYKYDSEEIYNIPLVNVKNIHEYANCVVFQQLSIFFEKSSHFDDALRVCEAGISCGYLDDGTKMGMLGRKQRILKGKSKANG